MEATTKWASLNSFSGVIHQPFGILRALYLNRIVVSQFGTHNCPMANPFIQHEFWLTHDHVLSDTTLSKESQLELH
jgi:hypothetical protein